MSTLEISKTVIPMSERKVHKGCGGRVLELETTEKGVGYDLVCQKCDKNLYKEDVIFDG